MRSKTDDFSLKDFLFYAQQPPLSAVSTARPATWRRRRETSLAEVAELLCTRATPACCCAACRSRAGSTGRPRQDGGGAPPHPAGQPGEPDPPPAAGELLSQRANSPRRLRLAEDRLDLLTRCSSSSSVRPPGRAPDPAGALHYRPLPQLLPTGPLRRSEIHLSRQIFQRPDPAK